LCGVVDRSFEKPHRHLRALRQFLGQGQRAFVKHGIRHDLMNEAQRMGLLCLDNLLSHQEIHGLRHAHMLHEQILAPFIRQQSEPKRRAPHSGRGAGDSKITGKRE